MPARVDNGIEPMTQLPIEVVEMAERSSQKEILPDVPKRPPHLAFGLGAIGPTGSWMEAEMAGKIDKVAIIDDALRAFIAGDRGLHPIIENLAWQADDRVESGGVATRHCRQILVQDEAHPDQAAIAEHHGEQPDDPRRCRLIGKDDVKLGEVDLSLLARRSLKPNFIPGRRRLPQEIRDGGIAALVATALQLPEQALPGQAGIGSDALSDRWRRARSRCGAEGEDHRPAPRCAQCTCARS